MNFVTDTKWIQLLFAMFCMAHGVPQPHNPESVSRPSNCCNRGSSQSSGSSKSQSSNCDGCTQRGSSQRQSSSTCNADAREPWSYEGDNGPGNWYSTYRTCSGQTQSPIAINMNALVHDDHLSKLVLNGYDIPVSKATIQNSGRSVTVTPEDKVQRSIILNGSTYKLSGIHFHWGDSSNRGSEHMIDGINRTMEVHFVHKCGKTKIAVVGAFFQEQTNMIHKGLRPIVQRLCEVPYKDQKTQLRSSLTLNLLIPANPASYLRYVGSLTTPSCDEGVIWSLLTKRGGICPLPVGTKQMNQFRRLYCVRKSEANQNCMLVNNFRPVQPLNQRVVFSSA